MTDRVRCFFCLPLAPELQKETAAWIAANRGAVSGIRWTAEANLHITLRFCGEIPQAAAQTLGTRVKTLLSERYAAPLALTLRKTGTFGRPPRVLWAGLGGGTAQLERLNALIESACVESGLPPDGRKFSPHLTLARMDAARGFNPAALDALRPWNLAGRGWTADRAIFMRSRLTPAGPRYEPLAVCRLGMAADGA